MASSEGWTMKPFAALFAALLATSTIARATTADAHCQAAYDAQDYTAMAAACSAAAQEYAVAASEANGRSRYASLTLEAAALNFAAYGNYYGHADRSKAILQQQAALRILSEVAAHGGMGAHQAKVTVPLWRHFLRTMLAAEAK